MVDDEGGGHAGVASGAGANHGASVSRGLANVALSSVGRGRYGRMFRRLRPNLPSDESLRALADSMGPYPIPAVAEGPGPPVAAAAPQPGENPDLPAGYTYLGQFVDHDITFDPVSSLERRNDPDALVSFRTPRFDLDSLYGSGPADSPWLYDQEDPVKLLVGHNTGGEQEPEDLPRNQQGRALVGDPRNDVHVIISQLTLAFVRFHNAVVDHLRDEMVPAPELFDEAQRVARWHYQWLVIEDYVRPLVGPDILDQVLITDPVTGARRADLRFFHWKQEPFMPVEFSAAAFRFGHSQVRATYRLNPSLDPLHIFLPWFNPAPTEQLGGFRPLPRGWKIQWDLFFAIDGSSPQLSRRIDTKVTGPMAQLPPMLDQARRPIALLDMLRGKALGLPSGEAVAAAMGTGVTDTQLGLTAKTPLWYYLLRESEVVAEGRRLGPTAATIVAEVFVGLLHGDPSSFLRIAPGWTPTLPSAEPGRFTIVDLLRFAGVT
ncbi:MAG: heme peroxidase family protein [Actinomycetota bacterium]|nr:heme peroxidase family protein [Actinomycetota bacterium]